jgi:hypothetical protein
MTTATPAVASPAPTLVGCLASLLAGFTGAAESVILEARSLHGFGRVELPLRPPIAAVPMPLIGLLEDAWGIRFTPATREGDGTPVSLAYAFALWPIALDFGEATGWTHQPNAAALDRIVAALRGFEAAPTFLIDGLREVAALWSLSAPLDVRREAARARALQRQLAATLDADVAAGEDLATTLPLPGSIVRGVGAVAPIPLVRFAVVAPERRYAIDQLEAACAGDGARQKGAVR